MRENEKEKVEFYLQVNSQHDIDILPDNLKHQENFHFSIKFLGELEKKIYIKVFLLFLNFFCCYGEHLNLKSA